MLVLLAALVAGGVVLAGGWLDGGDDGGDVSASASPAAPAQVDTHAARRLAPPPENAPQPHAWARTPADGASAVHIDFRKPPRSGLLVDAQTGEVLWSEHPERVLPIASVTKIMTALLVEERVRPREPVRITREAVEATGSKVVLLPRNRRARAETLLYGLMLPSGNDAAIALAQHVSGSVPRFVRLMNRRARELGLTCTRFASPSGIVDEGNHSCAPDLALLGRLLLERPRLARVVRTPMAVLPLPIRGGRVWLNNHNPLLAAHYPGADGVKTGYTDAAGRCFVASASRAGRRLIAVLLDSPDPGRQARRLLDAGFATGA